jgi:uncharacterized RDD family membrane protein YckC
MPEQDVQYAGFWIRFLAFVIDSLLVMAITAPLLVAIFGWSYFNRGTTGWLAALGEFAISWVLPAVAVIVFWIYRQATPGKQVLSVKIVDARTGEALTAPQCIGRYLGYYASAIPFGLGLIWVAFDRRKQGWHDKLAGTVVIRERK